MRYMTRLRAAELHRIGAGISPVYAAMQLLLKRLLPSMAMYRLPLETMAPANTTCYNCGDRA
jgi:hypothetical protein